MNKLSPRRLVALTVDAEHPDRRSCAPGNIERILAVLDRAGIRATFFLQGRWVTAYPQVACEVAARGHLIGNHSHFHVPMTLLTTAGQEADVIAAQEAIQSFVGVDPRPWFRSPFGAGLADPGLSRTLVRLGYRNVPWDLDGSDWEDGTSAAAVEEALVAGGLAGEGPKIVLLHSWPDPAAGALAGVISRLTEAGTEFVTLDSYPVRSDSPARSLAARPPRSRASRDS
jgi:peptidoglycan/xylan/chitin deacetylase (PgdA/CDA1 family)